ncbi:MAG: cytochrome d ubiquinol oxidase subunit II [Phycisphaerae bacterium]
MLPTIWFFIWAVLWAVFFMTDGYNLGLGSLLFFVTKTQKDRRLAISTMAPFWDPNQVWLIAAGGMTFAVFPIVYATLFSSLYLGMMLLLFGLIFELREKSDHPVWKKFWDGSLVFGSFLPTILFGIVFANLFCGMPIDAQGTLRGGLLAIFHPYAFVGALLFFAMFTLHGLLWLAVKTQGNLNNLAISQAKNFWWLMLVALIVFLPASAFATNLYHNYRHHPILLIFPIIIIAALILIRIFLATKSTWKAFFASAGMIFFITIAAFTGLYPNIVPSTLNPSYSLTIQNAASSNLTLKIMLIVVSIFVPIIILYQAWANYIFRNKVSEKEAIYDETSPSVIK